MEKIGLISVEEASRNLLEYAAPLEKERLPLMEALGRVCGEDIVAVMDHPPFDCAAMDGYALRRNDLTCATNHVPVQLPVTQWLYAGSTTAPLQQGSAARIMTGAPVPRNADCVIPQELSDCGEQCATFYNTEITRDNICHRGESVARGMVLACRGIRLNFAHIGLLAGQGYTDVPVFRKPRIAVLPTGDELKAVGTPLPSGGIYDSNSALLCARLMELGAEAVPLPVAPDQMETLCGRIRDALHDCHMVITTGGVSVGQKDLLPIAVNRLNCRTLFHGIDAKPGTPALGAVWEGKPIICLSGNPFAALVTFELLARPLVCRFSGDTYTPERRRAILETPFTKPTVRRRFVRGLLEDGHVSLPVFNHNSGGLAGLAQCNCLLDIPEGTSALCRGDMVDTIML